MLKAPIPADEEKRYADLLRYDILDTDEENDYSALTELAAQICDCHSATITFIDKDRQWFKAKKNMPTREGPREDSFCGHVILHEKVMIIKNAAEDTRFADNPDVLGGLKIGFYAGAPIISSEGNKLGTVCVIDKKPKLSVTKEQEHALEIIASQVTKLLELRLKNKLIAEQAIALINAEKNIARLNMQIRENQDSRIAYELHENIAQVIAVAKMTAETDDNNEVSQKLAGYLSLILDDIKALTYSITPTTFTSADYKAYIFELADKAAAEKNIRISFSPVFDTMPLRKTIGLAAYRIIQYLLSYAEMSGATEIKADFEEGKETSSIILTQNGDKIPGTDEAKMIINNIITRASIINGKFAADKGYNRIELTFNNRV